MIRGAIGVATLEEQEREAVVRAGEFRRDFEGTAIVPDRFFPAAGPRQRDRDVLQNLDVRRLVAQRELIGRDRAS